MKAWSPGLALLLPGGRIQLQGGLPLSEPKDGGQHRGQGHFDSRPGSLNLHKRADGNEACGNF